MDQRVFLDFNGAGNQIPKTIDFDDISDPQDSLQENGKEMEQDGLEVLSVWCDECGVYNIGECFIHGDMTVAPDNELPSRAILSLPKKILSLKRLKAGAESGHSNEGKRGVFVKKAMKPRTQFGPMEGVKITSKPKLEEGSMEYELIDSKWGKLYLHLVDESKCNWMMFVRPAHDFNSQNLAAFQKNDAIYFVTIKNIPVGTELCVWYSAAYAKSMGKEILLPPIFMKKSPVKANAVSQGTGKCETDKQPKPSSASSSRKLKEKITSRERIPRVSKMRDTASSSGSLLECATCGMSFDRISQKVSHACVELDEETETDSINILEIGVRRRKGRPRKLVNNVVDPTKDMSSCLSQDLSSIMPSIDIPNREEIASILDREKVMGTTNAIGSPTINGNADGLSAYDFISTSNGEIGCGIDSLKNSGASRDDKDKSSEVSDTSYSCDQCSYSSVSLEILKAHKVTHTKATEYICGVDGCSKIFGSKFKFLRHLNVHIKTNQYRCKICSSTFNRSDHLKNHMPIHACNRTKYSCDICGKSYLYKSTLLFHKAKHVANEGTSLNCLVCEQNFNTLAELKAHVNSHNRYKPDPNKEKVHECPQCNKRFLTNKDVTRHLITHSKERAFLCEHCPQTFVRKDHLRRHYISHHKKEIYESQMKTNTYGCPVCLKVFKKKEFLDYHLQDIHPNGIPEPEPPRKSRNLKKPDFIQNVQKTRPVLQENLILQASQFQTPFAFPTNLQPPQQQIVQQSSPILQTQSPVQNKDIQQHSLESDYERLDFNHLSQALGLQPVQTSKALPSSQIVFPTPSQNSPIVVAKEKSSLNLPAFVKSEAVKLPEQILKFVTKPQEAAQLQSFQQLQQQSIQLSLSQQQKQQEQQLKSVQAQSVQQQQQQLLFQLQQQQQKQLQLLQNQTSEDKNHSILTPTVKAELAFPSNIISLVSSFEPTKNIEWSLTGDPSSKNKISVSSTTDSISDNIAPSLSAVNSTTIEKPDHCYATVSSSQLQAASSTSSNNISLAIANNNLSNSLKITSSNFPVKSTTEEELLKLLSFLKPAKIAGTFVENETENQKQQQLQSISNLPEQLPQQQQEDFGNQQQVVANFPVSWADNSLTDFSGLGDLSLASDVIMTGGVTPMTNWIIVQQPQQQQSFIPQQTQSQHQGHLVQEQQQSQLQLLQQAQLLQQQTQLFQQQQQQQNQLLQPQAQAHLLQQQSQQQHKTLTVPISNG